jgi:hypothetical protein
VAEVVVVLLEELLPAAEVREPTVAVTAQQAQQILEAVVVAQLHQVIGQVVQVGQVL